MELKYMNMMFEPSCLRSHLDVHCDLMRYQIVAPAAALEGSPWAPAEYVRFTPSVLTDVRVRLVARIPACRYYLDHMRVLALKPPGDDYIYSYLISNELRTAERLTRYVGTIATGKSN